MQKIIEFLHHCFMRCRNPTLLTLTDSVTKKDITWQLTKAKPIVGLGAMVNWQEHSVVGQDDPAQLQVFLNVFTAKANGVREKTVKQAISNFWCHCNQIETKITFALLPRGNT